MAVVLTDESGVNKQDTKIPVQQYFLLIGTIEISLSFTNHLTITIILSFIGINYSMSIPASLSIPPPSLDISSPDDDE